jgi:hypothetical protein
MNKRSAATYSFTILLSLCVAAAAIPYGVTASWYVLNKEYIAENLCVNIDRPEMECEGKCQVDAKSRRGEERSSDDVSAFCDTVVLTAQEPSRSHRSHNIFTRALYTAAPVSFYSYTPPIFIFHPPDFHG